MKFTVPFLPDDAYIRFLADHAAHLYSVYFSLSSPLAADARHRLGELPPEDLAAALSRLPDIPCYALLNTRFHDPDHCLAAYGLTARRPDASPPGAFMSSRTEDEAPSLRTLGKLMDRLGVLHDRGRLTGIIFADFYQLHALSHAAPETAARLEAVPSVNFMADTPAKLQAVMDGIAASAFRMPKKLSLERSLNRRPRARKKLLAFCRARYPELEPELLANEGCLSHCEFKPAHDALIALSHLGIGVDTRAMNQTAGCIRQLREYPWRILRSPFIRPEDLAAHAGEISVVKLAGRTLGPDFLTNTAAAYIRGAYDGSLFRLLDASHWMSEDWNLPNTAFPPDFLARVTTCDADCDACGYCPDLFERIARPKPAAFPDLRTGSAAVS
ncbi:MAG: hypothetical protein CSB33_00770 [Desulfobacterales bacterium]|nr:MAG: hypothetical protein CSB33_00770 [Desulfobacterales bacterium]